jgi:hypothetical protein
MDIKDIALGDIAMLKDRRGFLRVDEICGNEIRQKANHPTCRGGGAVSWCDAELVEAVGRFVKRAPPEPELPPDKKQPHCDDCAWLANAWHCTMNCSGRTERGVTKGIMP